MRYVLASASERRHELLKRVIENFDIIVSNFDEDSINFTGDVEKYVTEIAEGKAMEVASNIKDEAIIIAADTIVTINNRVLGKPKDNEDAYNMLKQLSGNIHEVYSAVVIVNTKKNIVKKECVCTKVKFSILRNEDINRYINTKEPYDKAGAYGIQGKGSLFVEEINGCYYNVVGLPLNKINKMLRNSI